MEETAEPRAEEKITTPAGVKQKDPKRVEMGKKLAAVVQSSQREKKASLLKPQRLK